MKAYNKIFFNLGPGADAGGLGDLIKALTDRKIPMFLAGTDGMAGLYDLQTAAQQSKVPHFGNIRYTGYTNSGFYLENPDFTRPVEVTAPQNWAEHKKLWPPEMDKNIISVSTINEARSYLSWGQQGSDPTDWPAPVPGYTGWADWQGHFAYIQGLLAVEQGYKYFAYSWATGNPEEGAYTQPWQVEYLKLCAKHPTQLGIALNEYSLTAADLFDGGGRKVGRFKDIHKACDLLGIPYPMIIFREFGWSYTTAPGESKAMQEIKTWAAELAKYPNVLGAGLWTLINAQNWGDVYSKIKPLMKPIETFTLETVFEVDDPSGPPVEPPPIEPPAPPPPQDGNLLENPRFSGDLYLSSLGVKTPDGWQSHWQNSPNPIDPAGWAVFQKPTGGYGANGFSLGGENMSWFGGIFQDVTAAPGIYRLNVVVDGNLAKKVEGDQIVYADDPAGNDGLIRLNGGDWQSIPPGETTVFEINVTVPNDGKVRVSVDFMCPFPLPKNYVEIYIVEFFALTLQPPPIEPPPIEPPAAPGLPRIDFKRVCWVLNHDPSLAAYLDILNTAKSGRFTVGFSFDDAGIGKLSDKTAVVWGRKIAPLVLKKWYSIHYPGVKFQALTVDGDPVNLPIFDFEAWPTEFKRINQPFGANPANYEKFDLPGHEGIDLLAPFGTFIYAAAAGVVKEVSPVANGHNYGAFVRIDHIDGYQTTYAHLKEFPDGSAVSLSGETVKAPMVGQYMQAGDLVGVSGNTGNSFGAHLHLTLKSDRAYKGGPSYIGYPYNIVDPTPHVDGLLLAPSALTAVELADGKPRVGYKRTYNLIVGDPTSDQLTQVAAVAYGKRETVGYSADDAGIGDLESRNVVLWAGVWDETKRADYAAFFQAYYPGVVFSFSEFAPAPAPPQPPSGDPGFGLNASADPGWFYGKDLEHGEFSILSKAFGDRMVVKILSAHAPESVSRLAADCPGATWIVRLFLKMERRSISPMQFFNDTFPDLKRTLDVLEKFGVGKDRIVLETGNEPNLSDEGLLIDGQGSWVDGKDFGGWALEVLKIYSAALPGYQFAFPGVSPGGAYADPSVVKHDSVGFLAAAAAAVAAFPVICLHGYWSSVWPMAKTLAQIDQHLALIPPGKPVYITEASINDRPAPIFSDRQYADQYVAFWNELKRRPQIKGVAFFVASASNGHFAPECWIVNGKTRGIAAAVASIV